MKNLPDLVLSHPGSEVPSRVEANSQGREIRLNEPRSMRLLQNGPTQRSNLFESHWSNQWLTSVIVRSPN